MGGANSPHNELNMGHAHHTVSVLGLHLRTVAKWKHQGCDRIPKRDPRSRDDAFDAIAQAEAIAGDIQRATYQDVLDAPAHQVAEIINGTLYTHSRPAMPHALASSNLRNSERADEAPVVADCVRWMDCASRRIPGGRRI